MNKADVDKVASDAAKDVDKALDKAKDKTKHTVGEAGSESRANVNKTAYKEIDVYTGRAKKIYANASEGVDQRQKDYFAKVEQDAFKQSNASKHKIIKAANKQAETRATIAHIQALKQAALDAKLMIRTAHVMEEDISEAAHTAKEAARHSWTEWQFANEQAQKNKNYALDAYNESNIAKYEVMGAGENVETGSMSSNSASESASNAKKGADNAMWRASEVSKLAHTIKAQVQATEGGIETIRAEVANALKASSEANREARAATELSQKLIRQLALGHDGSAPAGAPAGPGGPAPAGAPGAPGAAPAGHAPGAALLPNP